MTSSITTKPILFFDGLCNLCSGSVDVLMRLDRNKKFLYASLQGETAKKIPEINSSGVESVVLYKNGVSHFKSNALLQIANELGGAYKLLLVFKILPLTFRDWLYDLIANNRYKWFGKKESCRLPTEEERDQFLD